MVSTGAADASCVRSTTPRTWSGFGSRQLLSTHRQDRMTVQFNHNGTPSASLAVWMYIVHNETIRCPLLLGRDSWMRFHSSSYQTLSPQPDGRNFGELTLSLCDDNLGSAADYIRKHEISDAAYHLVYDGQGVSLTDSPQLIPVNLVRLDGSPALTGYYMVNLLPVHLTGYQELEPGDVLGTASSPLLRGPMETLTLHDVTADFLALLNRLPLQHRRPLSHTALRPISRTNHPPNSYTDSTTANANIFFASGAMFPLTFVGEISRWTSLVEMPLPLTPSPQPLPPTRTSSRPPNWTSVNVPYVRSRSRCLQGLSRSNRVLTDVTQSSPNR